MVLNACNTKNEEIKESCSQQSITVNYGYTPQLQRRALAGHSPIGE